MKFSIGQAATETGKPKSTISRAIKSGRLSATKNGNRYDIDAAELFRVFPATVAQPDNLNEAERSTQPNTESRETILLREMLERERETVTDLRERLTRAELQLTDHRSKPRKWWHIRKT
jgi:excisionase family DNA binding protein